MTARAQVVALRDDWFAAQIRYHEANRARMVEAIDRCERLAKGCFWTALICDFVHIALDVRGFHASPLLSGLFLLVAAGLPAWAGALFAIKVQGEFDRLAERSEAMAHRLRRHVTDIDRVLADGAATSTVDVRRVRAIAWSAAADMAMEVRDWHTLYIAHPIPAG